MFINGGRLGIVGNSGRIDNLKFGAIILKIGGIVGNLKLGGILKLERRGIIDKRGNSGTVDSGLIIL